MTVAEALGTIRRVGTVESHSGVLKLKFPEDAASRLRDAVETLKAFKTEALTLLSEPTATELDAASHVLRRNGVRFMQIDGKHVGGVWSDLDGPELRAALRILGTDHLPVRYLDGTGIPARYKLRDVPGQPVPLSVLAAMELEPFEPWKVRDRQAKRRRLGGYGSEDQ